MGPNHTQMYICVCVHFGVHVDLYHVSREYLWKNMHGNKGAKEVERPKWWTVMNTCLEVISDPFPSFLCNLISFWVTN